ncbi:hypothetical protein [Pseudovibrio sp. SPO723]|uniref:hypothetical protein n=1 Tax=Nesiotobacter zosterae TaxID=392721 RepID=UPI0029C2D480|nr:hypothetical protein [Pseudovibrio sp. SPO723]MDX5592278.1 hypothetical protein [Pseudovibrio sp. SPO723]
MWWLTLSKSILQELLCLGPWAFPSFEFGFKPVEDGCIDIAMLQNHPSHKGYSIF